MSLLPLSRILLRSSSQMMMLMISGIAALVLHLGYWSHSYAAQNADFVALPCKASYRLIYNANSEICSRIDKAIAVNEFGEVPDIYRAVAWSGIWPRFYTTLPISYIPNTVSSETRGEQRAVVAKHFFAGRIDDQTQFLSIRVDVGASKEVLREEDFDRSAMKFDPQSFAYSLRQLRPWQYPSGHFGSKGNDIASFDDGGNELIAANFFDVVLVNEELLISFRSHNVVDMALDGNAREWLIFARLLVVDPRFHGASKEIPKILGDLCYFVRQKSR